MRQWSFVIEHRAEIAHVEPAAARFAFEKVFALVRGSTADALTDDGAARDRRRHARNLSHALASSS
jgi:hypothetical protein